MFQVIVAMVVIGVKCASFEEAFRRFYAEINKMTKEGTSVQVLETACFIQYTFEDEGETLHTAMGFYDCCDLANQLDLLRDDGALEERACKENPIKDIQNTFLRNTVAEINGILEMAEKVRGVMPSA